jgi:hypothetical protein
MQAQSQRWSLCARGSKSAVITSHVIWAGKRDGSSTTGVVDEVCIGCKSIKSRTVTERLIHLLINIGGRSRAPSVRAARWGLEPLKVKRRAMDACIDDWGDLAWSLSATKPVS